MANEWFWVRLKNGYNLPAVKDGERWSNTDTWMDEPGEVLASEPMPPPSWEVPVSTRQRREKPGGTLALSWGAWGGIYLRRNYSTRLCLGWLALTYFPRDLDFLLEALADTAAAGRWNELKKAAAP